ncbi:hypothetical protein LPJ64_000648 [Coemansia asiatica]|uniref:Uncharacterized protein n=1 Tax=Coemansia asiatica TaxID=1052880 RepID=A0A9W8CKQ3_9FUNG|nr:hypothetical protein LPJ64_000648 [Coemansia asiatica]KAJ2870776.1 hypothetical protein FB639_004570 [Coemansia asiatica]
MDHHPKPAVPQPIPAKRQKTEATESSRSDPTSSQRATATSLISGSPTEELLAQSPNYMTNCELYPRVMRDTVNQHTNEVFAKRDPRVTRQAEKYHQEELRRQKQFSEMHPKEALSLYPAAARSGSSL